MVDFNRRRIEAAVLNKSREPSVIETRPLPQAGTVANPPKLSDTLVVKLTYFKESGKYYSEGEYETPRFLRVSRGSLPAGIEVPAFLIYAQVRELMEKGELPGLMKGHSPFSVLVDVPQHSMNVPALIHPEKG